MTLAVVQHKSGVFGSTVPGTVTLNAAPTAGNLLVAFVGVNIGVGTLTINTAGWTEFARAVDDNDSSMGMVGLYRYVQAGDTATTPAFATSGSTYYTALVYEVSGVTGSWDTDAHHVNAVYQGGGTTNAISTATGITGVANCLALSAVAKYNGNANPTLGGLWTVDEAANNNSNYGSLGGASMAVASAYTSVNAAWTTSSNSDLQSSMLLILATGQAVDPTVRQSYYRSASGTPGSFKFPLPVRTGNLILAFVSWGNGGAATPTIGSGWSTEATAVDSGSAPAFFCLSRYVQAGDAGGLPALFSAGSAWYSVQLIEISGVTGSGDVQSTKTGWQGSGSSLTTTADSTTAANCLALAAFANYDGNSIIPTPSGWAVATEYKDFGNFGSWAVFQQQDPASATSVSATTTIPSTGTSSTYIQIILLATGAGGGVTPTDMVVTQVGVEAWVADNPAVNVTQVGAEAWLTNDSEVIVTQFGLEVWRSTTSDSTAMSVSQLGLEVWEQLAYTPSPPRARRAIVVIMGG